MTLSELNNDLEKLAYKLAGMRLARQEAMDAADCIGEGCEDGEEMDDEEDEEDEEEYDDEEEEE